jgi:hypothetical protein
MAGATLDHGDGEPLPTQHTDHANDDNSAVAAEVVPPETAKVRSCQRAMNAIIAEMGALEVRLKTARGGVQQSPRRGGAVYMEHIDQLCLRDLARELNERASTVAKLALELANAEPVEPVVRQDGRGGAPPLPPGVAPEGPSSESTPLPAPPRAVHLQAQQFPVGAAGLEILRHDAAERVVVRPERKFGRPRIP